MTAIPRDSNGQYSLPPIYLATTGQTVLAVQHNSPCEDMAAALTGSLARNGSGDMQADLPMGGFRVRNMADGTASTDAVSKAQLDAVIASLQTPTGAVMGFYRTTAPSGWVRLNGNTIGSASSGATERANVDTRALFIALWGSFNNSILPIFNSDGSVGSRGSSSASDFEANKRLTLFDDRGYFHRGWDNGRGIDPGRVLGTVQQDAFELHGHTATVSDARPPIATQGGGSFNAAFPYALVRADGTPSTTVTAQDAHDHDVTISSTGGTETRPVNRALLYCIKL